MGQGGSNNWNKSRSQRQGIKLPNINQVTHSDKYISIAVYCPYDKILISYFGIEGPLGGNPMYFYILISV